MEQEQPSTPQETSMNIVILIPVYNEWRSVDLLIPLLNDSLKDQPYTFDILLIDDCSTHPWGQGEEDVCPTNIQSIKALRLQRNLGHQRAIAIGLAYIYRTISCCGVVIMDGDGEDMPESLPALLSTFNLSSDNEIVFAERTRRSEDLIFRVCYNAYRIVHKLLTGIRVRVGNFSVLPFEQVEKLVVSSELWNHYAAACFKLKLPKKLIPIPRGKRLDGKSKMNFVSLVLHGLSAISVFGEIVGVRILMASGVSIAFLFSLIGIVIFVRFGTSLSIPGWATYTLGLLLILTVQLMTISSGIVLHLLSRRESTVVLPILECEKYIDRIDG